MKMRKQQEIVIKLNLFSNRKEIRTFFMIPIAHFFNKNIKLLINLHFLEDFWIKSRCFNRVLFTGHESGLALAYSTAHNLNLLYQSN